MKFKMVSIILCIVIGASISIPIPQNVGQSNSSSNGTVGLVLSNMSAPIPQIVGQPSSSPSGTSGLANSPWPMFRHNLNHTGLSPYDTSSNPGKLKWIFKAGQLIQSSPTIDSNGIIYFGSYDDKLYAINSNGTEKWNFSTGYDVTSSPAISSDGTIYVSSEDGKLYAINPEGTEKWCFVTGFYNMGWSSPAIGFDGTIYIGSRDNKLYAIYPNGTQKWNFLTEDWVDSSPAIGSDGTIYIGSYDGKLYAINPDGTERWNFTTGERVRSSPTIGSDGTIYVGSHDHKIYAINPDGSEKWSFMTGQTVISSPAIGSNGMVYVGSGDGKLYSINQNGTENWSFTTSTDITSSPSIGMDGTIYIGSWDQKFYAIHPNGTEKWSFITNGYLESSPAIGSDGTIYVGSWDCNLYAIGTPNIPPIPYTGPDQTLDEGDVIHFDGAASYDPDGTIETYKWDFDSSDGLWWETGATPDATGPTPIHVYGDDGLFIATLRVTDNDNLSATDICNITILNVDPIVSIESAIMDVEIGLRVAGRKFNDIGMTLFEEGNSIGYVSIERLPGSPNEQMAWIPAILDMTKTYSVTVTFTPEDPPNVGANPVWIYIKSENGSIRKIHHTFNVQQSKKRNSDHWNHIEPWEVDLSGRLIGLPFEITSHIIDPGSDDETLTFTYGSQVKTVTYLNNPPNPDPYPSPEVNPRDIMDATALIYEGTETVMLVVKDDDNIRLGVGEGTDYFSVG